MLYPDPKSGDFARDRLASGCPICKIVEPPDTDGEVIIEHTDGQRFVRKLNVLEPMESESGAGEWVLMGGR